MPNEAKCSISEYINGMIFLHAPKVMKIEKRNFFTSLTSDQHSLEEEEPNDVSFGFEPKIKSFSEAIHSLEEVKAFLDAKGCSEQATVVASAADMVASLNCSSLASGRQLQSTLDEYLD